MLPGPSMQARLKSGVVLGQFIFGMRKVTEDGLLSMTSFIKLDAFGFDTSEYHSNRFSMQLR